MKQKIGLFVPITLGMLTAFGPFVTDFYLPVLPEMAEYFSTSPSLVSMSLTTGMLLKESLPPSQRMKKSVIRVYGNLFKVFRNPLFTLCTVSMMTGAFAFFAYIASSPFILQQIYRLSPFHFSLCFGVNALMIGIGSGLCTLFRSQASALKCGAIDFLIATVLVSFFLITNMPLVLLMAAYIYMLLSFGLMQPAVIAIALDSERQNAGAAGAIFGASMFLAGALSSPLVGLGNITRSSSIVIMAGALACLLVTLPLCRRLRRKWYS